MKSNIMFFIELILFFLPFIVFVLRNNKINIERENRYKQYAFPFLAILFAMVLLVFQDTILDLLKKFVLLIGSLLAKLHLEEVSSYFTQFADNWNVFVSLVVFNTLALILFVLCKKIAIYFYRKKTIDRESIAGKIVQLFYDYDEVTSRWYIRKHFGQARTFIKTAYYGSMGIVAIILMISCHLCLSGKMSTPLYPVYAIIILGEFAYFVDGVEKDEQSSNISMVRDKSYHIAMYPLLRNPLRALFGDKCSAEGTTVNNGALYGGSVEDILAMIEKEDNHIGKNYAAFIRRKIDLGFKPNVDYIRCGYELAMGKNLLFNTPFYDKLSPYIFYAMNRHLLTNAKVLIVLGRHGTEDDLKQWVKDGLKAVSNIPDLWNVKVLDKQKLNEDEFPDVGIITRSGVHDLDIHRNHLAFLRQVSFVVVVEPSRLVTTAQIGLNLLVKCCGKDFPITFCSLDRNCDGLVDALSHILMTNITEVSATEYPHGMSSYMYWKADNDYLQHRILPGVTRYLGIGTELSMVALKHQVRKTVWYGGDAFPVLDVHWIAKQYYYDLLHYAKLPANQETFDAVFQASFNMCNEKVSDYSFISVEDDRNNLFETRRNFATIAEQQGFINVISSEYMLREYMAKNPELFTADPKAIPYMTADYARSKRNSVLSICLMLCVDTATEADLARHLILLNMDGKDPASLIWKEICNIFTIDQSLVDSRGQSILCIYDDNHEKYYFKKEDTIIFKREYSIKTGKFESVYSIENENFKKFILDDLQNATYIAEQENKDVYIGTELKGHVYQKYLPGQFFTLNGKYYEMISTTNNQQILVRRASEFIDGRLSYRQVRRYHIHHLEDHTTMGNLKTINQIKVHYQLCDFHVETSGYWKMRVYNDFDHADYVELNGIPSRSYLRKKVLKLDFSEMGDAFTDDIRMSLTTLLNEVFVTLFAENQPFISAVTLGQYQAPLTYSLEMDEGIENMDKSIFIIEDSQLDIGLLVTVERNLQRIFQIISDYLSWNEEEIEASKIIIENPIVDKIMEHFDVYEEDPIIDHVPTLMEKVKSFFGRIFKRKKKDKSLDQKGEDVQPIDKGSSQEKETPVNEEENVIKEDVSQLETEDIVEAESDISKETDDEGQNPTESEMTDDE